MKESDLQRNRRNERSVDTQVHDLPTSLSEINSSLEQNPVYLTRLEICIDSMNTYLQD